jgi:predicted RNA-binding Zn-ribbon protein involved in translation (DUF1610 family)
MKLHPDNCPKCGASWIGEPIPEKDRATYGATHFGRVIGEYDDEADRTVAWKCPDCERYFDRWTLAERSDLGRRGSKDQ